MVRGNDDLRLIFRSREEPTTVAFEAIGKIVADLEEYLGFVAAREKASRAHRLILVASPRRGSLELVFQLDPSGVKGALSFIAETGEQQGIDVWELIERASTIGSFLLALAFAPWGTLAGLTRQSRPPPADEPLQEQLGRLAEVHAAQMKRLEGIDARLARIQTDALATGCESVALNLRGYGEVSLVSKGTIIYKDPTDEDCNDPRNKDGVNLTDAGREILFRLLDSGAGYNSAGRRLGISQTAVKHRKKEWEANGGRNRAKMFIPYMDREV